MTDIRTAHCFDDELARMDAVATAEALAAKDLGPREVVEAAIRRAERMEPSIHAIVESHFDRALDRAARGRNGGWAGVPTFIKDLVDVEGMATRWGSAALTTAPPARKSLGIAGQIGDMGFVTLGKSTLPEFGFTPSTEPAGTEPTRNPWNLDHSAGGSSGGAAALVAAGVVPIAHAADGGGSTRIPAACCGLVGLKPTRGRLLPHADEQLLPVAVTVDGVVTRSVRDTARFYAEAEKHFRNPKLPPMGLVNGPPPRRLRIGAVIDVPFEAPIDAPTRRVFAETVTLLEELGHRVEPMKPPVTAQFADDFIHYFQMLAFLSRATGRQRFGSHFDRDRLTSFTKGLASRFTRNLARMPGSAWRLRRSTALMHAVFGNLDVVLSPVTAGIAPPIGHLASDLPYEVLLPRVMAWVTFTPLANAAGTPAISLPLGWDGETNLPVGMMFAADLGQDALLLQLAFELEAARPWQTLRHGAGSAGRAVGAR